MKEKLRNKINGKDKKGITLVALVVTVVVLLILAGVSIVTLFGENGIITAAQKAAEKTEKGVNKELAELKKLEAMLDPWNEVKNEKGQVVAVEKGSQKLEIGDYINYDCTKNASGQAITESYTSYLYGKANNDHNGRTSGYSSDQTFKASDYTGKWRVLGAENGELLIMPATNVPLTLEGSTSTTKYFYLGSGSGTTYAEQGKSAYKYGPEELDNISKIYAKGKGATGEARSIRVEDVNKITGYKPEAPAGSADNKFGKKQLYEYDNKVTYTWKGGTAPYYTASNGYTPGTLTQSHTASGFTYWDEDSNDWIKSKYESTAQTSAITTLTSTYYSYYPETLTDTKDTSATTGISNSSKQRDMLFENSSSEHYWLGSRYVGIFTFYDGFGLRNVFGGFVGGYYLFDSFGYGRKDYYDGVRPVVSLSSDVKLTPVTDGGGIVSYNIN